MGEGTFLSFLRKERRENKDMEPYGSLLLTGGRRCTKCQITHAKIVESMKLTRCAEHMSFTYARDVRPALYKGLHATSARLVQKVVAGTGLPARPLQEMPIFSWLAGSPSPRDANFFLRVLFQA